MLWCVCFAFMCMFCLCLNKVHLRRNLPTCTGLLPLQSVMGKSKSTDVLKKPKRTFLDNYTV